MATTKTIEQLDAAAQINASDQLALAQDAGKEAVRGSVEMLAAKIADINAEGPYAELSAAVAAGKNLLAQNLRSKGVSGAAAGDTLVKLADEVNNLNVDTSMEDVWTNGLAKKPEHVNLATQRCPFIFLHMDVKGTVAVLSGTTLHLIKQGTFTNLTEFINGAVASVEIAGVDTNSSENKAAMARTADGTKILIRKNTTQYQVVNVDTAAGTLSLGEEYTSTTAIVSHYNGLAVSNDLKTVVIPNTYNADGTIVLWNPIDNTYSDAISIKGAGGYSWSSFVIEGDEIYLWAEPMYGTGYLYLSRIGFEVGADGVNVVTSPCAKVGLTSKAIDYCYEGRFFIGTPGPIQAITPSDTTMLALAAIQIWDIDKPQKEVISKTIKTFCPLNEESTFNVIEGQERFPIKSLGGGRYEIIIPTGTANAVYDKNARQFDAGEITATSVTYNGNNGRVDVNMCIAISDDGKNILATAQSVDAAVRLGRSIYSAGCNMLRYEMGVYLLGKKRTINGATVYYRPYKVTAEHAAAGYYERSTRVNPAPAAQGQA